MRVSLRILSRAPIGVCVRGGTYYISVGREVPLKGIQFFRVCLGRGVFHCKNSGKGLKYTCLERGDGLYGKGLLSYLCLE